MVSLTTSFKRLFGASFVATTIIVATAIVMAGCSSDSDDNVETPTTKTVALPTGFAKGNIVKWTAADGSGSKYFIADEQTVDSEVVTVAQAPLGGFYALGAAITDTDLSAAVDPTGTACDSVTVYTSKAVDASQTAAANIYAVTTLSDGKTTYQKGGTAIAAGLKSIRKEGTITTLTGSPATECDSGVFVVADVAAGSTADTNLYEVRDNTGKTTYVKGGAVITASATAPKYVEKYATIDTLAGSANTECDGEQGVYVVANVVAASTSSANLYMVWDLNADTQTVVAGGEVINASATSPKYVMSMGPDTDFSAAGGNDTDCDDGVMTTKAIAASHTSAENTYAIQTLTGITFQAGGTAIAAGLKMVQKVTFTDLSSATGSTAIDTATDRNDFGYSGVVIGAATADLATAAASVYAVTTLTDGKTTYQLGGTAISASKTAPKNISKVGAGVVATSSTVLNTTGTYYKFG